MACLAEIQQDSIARSNVCPEPELAALRCESAVQHGISNHSIWRPLASNVAKSLADDCPVAPVNPWVHGRSSHPFGLLDVSGWP